MAETLISRFSLPSYLLTQRAIVKVTAYMQTIRQEESSESRSVFPLLGDEQRYILTFLFLPLIETWTKTVIWSVENTFQQRLVTWKCRSFKTLETIDNEHRT